MKSMKMYQWVLALSVCAITSCSKTTQETTSTNVALQSATSSSSSLISASAVTAVAYPNTGTNGIVGFAKQAGVTGGTGGSVVYVNSISGLASAVAGTTKSVVVIASNLSANSLTKVAMGSNKTIVGSYGSGTLYNIHLRASTNSQNIIIQNITFSHSASIKGNDDIQVYLNYGNKYWVDHCTFPGHTWNANDGSLDKLIYIGDNADYATVSHCSFANHKYGCIYGHPEDDNNSSYNGFPHLTISFNHYENMEVRAPGLMRYGYFHVYDNYINKYGLGFTLSQNANVISMYNSFGSSTTTNGMVDNKKLNTRFTDNGSVPTLTSTATANWTIPYSYTAVSASQAVTWVSAHAGAQKSASSFVFP